MIIVECTLLAEVDLISAGVVGLIALIVFVFAILSAKNWHWVNVVLLIFTLIASITSIIGMTRAFDHRQKGMIEFFKQEDAAIRAEKKLAEIISGDPLSIKYEKGSLRDSTNQLALAMTGRGRSWRGGDVSVDDDSRKITFENERNLKDEASLTGATLYAFAENDNFPSQYVGSVIVTAETAKDFTVEAVSLVDIARFDKPNQLWTLFEKMPPDQHGIFVAALKSRVNSRKNKGESPQAKQRMAVVESMNDESKDLNIADFVAILKRDFLAARDLGFDPDSVAYQQLIDQYAFDGQPIGRIEQYLKEAGRDPAEFEPTPQEVFIKFKFTADSDTEKPVVTDADEDTGSLKSDGLYNSSGQAVVGALRQNPDGVSFKTNDVILIDEPSSVAFEQSHNGRLNRIDRIYVRQLQDFPLIFENMKLRAEAFENETIIAQATTAKTLVALEDARKQISFRAELLGQSTEDEERFTADLQNLQKTNQPLQQQVAEQAQQIQALKTKTDSQYQQIQAQALERLRAAVSVSQ